MVILLYIKRVKLMVLFSFTVTGFHERVFILRLYVTKIKPMDNNLPKL